MKKTQETPKVKEPRTIKVKTVAWVIAWAASIATTAIFMWFFTCDQMNTHTTEVQNAATSLINELSKAASTK
jgi:hypothetical protein